MPYIGNVPSSFNVGTDNINNDAITTAKIADGAILNADVNSAAAIAGTKISPDFGSQNLLTTGTSTAASFIPSSSTAPTNGLYLASANNVAISTNGTGRLFVDASGRVIVGASSAAVGNPLEVVATSNGNAIAVRGRSSDNVGIITFHPNASSTEYARIQAESDSALRFGTGSAGSERMRLDSSGRLGIGTTPGVTLDVNGQIRANNDFLYADSTATRGRVYGDSSGLVVRADTGLALRFHADVNERARIDTSGRLLVGTSSSVNNECIFQTSGDSVRDIALKYTGTSGGAETSFRWIDKNNQVNAQVGNNLQNDAIGTAAAHLVFKTATGGTLAERVRITQDGKIYMGQTSGFGFSTNRLEVEGQNAVAFKSTGTAGQQTAYIWHSATSGNNLFMEFGTESSINTRGSIDYNRGAGQVRYNVTSDRRLKSNIEDASSALNVLDQIKVRSYTWTETGYNIPHGFIAQELNEAVPDAVKVGDDGDEVVDTWAVDNAKLVPLLTKALQEALQKIDAMEARLSALEAS